MPKNDPLASYRAKRDFRSTPEPAGEEGAGAGDPRFVVQKHDASALHYDFRLEVDGVLKSWAVPKGPSTDPNDKRLAQPTEDHPLTYADFEGVIPSGYGAGAVIVWDRGTYRNLREDVPMPRALEEGKIEVLLEGEKLRGGYTLVRMGGRDAWLLIKKADAEADGGRDVLAAEPASVLSGRTIEQVRGAPEHGEPGPDDPPPDDAREQDPRGSRASANAPRTAPRSPRQKEPRASTVRASTVRVGRRAVELSNPDRVLFPDAGLTKGDLVRYYRRVADRMLPYLRERPLTLYRYPEGIDEGGFVQQQASEHFPDWIARATLDKEGGSVTHAVCNDAATLVYLANQNVVTPHVWLSRVDRPHRPDRMVLDLDPSGGPSDGPSGGAFEPVRRAAVAARALFDEIGLPAFVMTTGSTGLHLVTPLDRSADFDAVRGFANALAAVLARRHPDLVTTEHRKAKRHGRVYLDTLRNAYGQTAVPPYAVRALPGAPVATPLAWGELGRPDLHARRYTVGNLFRRLGQLKGDPWAELGRSALALTEPAHRLDAIRRKED